MVYYHLNMTKYLIFGEIFMDEQKRTASLSAEADGVIEDSAQLIVNRFQIDRGVRLALVVLVVQHLVLPSDDLLGGDIAHF